MSHTATAFVASLLRALGASTTPGIRLFAGRAPHWYSLLLRPCWRLLELFHRKDGVGRVLKTFNYLHEHIVT